MCIILQSVISHNLAVYTNRETGKEYAERIKEGLCYFDHLWLGLHWNDLQLRQTWSHRRKETAGETGLLEVLVIAFHLLDTDAMLELGEVSSPGLRCVLFPPPREFKNGLSANGQSSILFVTLWCP